MSCEDKALSKQQLSRARACPKCKTKKYLRFYDCCRCIYVHCTKCMNRGNVAGHEHPTRAIEYWNRVVYIAT
jgi:hypothetical protein